MAKNWKTTTLGVLSGFALIATQLTAILDTDPATTFSLEKFFAGLGLIGLGYFSKDKDVTGGTRIQY